MKKGKLIRTAYKAMSVLLIGFGLIYGLTMPIPAIPMLGHSWRNLLYHVPMWYTQIILLLVSGWHSIQYLQKAKPESDIRAAQAASVGIMFGILGLVTGIVWSRVTWGAAMANDNFSAWWAWDPKQIFALILLLIYLAYFLLRDSFNEPTQKAKISAVYNIFGAALIIPMYYIIPKAMGGLHPGSGEEGIMATLGNLGSYRAIFYPVVLGFILLAVWIWEIRVRFRIAEHKILEADL
ncbi:MAG: cytochrome c biogenesis protein CcsA [Bacteroidia bacterium]|nr:cytochrome c biogenesis protein CcsA [Bacteroidia bacterium]